MEKYKKQLVLASDKTDLKDFAKRHETIFQLENAKSDSFNISGPTSCHYIMTSNKLFDLYYDDEDYDEALDIAKEIFDLLKNNDDINFKSEAIINLAMAFLKNGNITKAKEITNKYSFDTSNPKYPYYCILKSNLANVFKNNTEEIYYLQKAFNESIKKNYKKEETSNILLAIALFYERNKIYDKAFSMYLEIFNNSNDLVLSLNNEERFSFLIRLANLAIINNNNSFAKEILIKCKTGIQSKLKKTHPLIKMVNKALESIEKKNN